MNHLRELYQEVILEHNNHPRNFKEICDCTSKAHGDNPLCGDTYDVFLQVEDNLVKEVSFLGHGCAISKASASMMTKRVSGERVDQVIRLIEAFRHLLTTGCSDEEMDLLGHLKVFEGVSKLPERVKCAVLPWHTLMAALNGDVYATLQENDE